MTLIMHYNDHFRVKVPPPPPPLCKEYWKVHVHVCLAFHASPACEGRA